MHRTSAATRTEAAEYVIAVFVVNVNRRGGTRGNTGVRAPRFYWYYSLGFISSINY